MNETQLKKISLIGSIIGLLALFLITNAYDRGNMKISQIDNSYENRIVNINGFIDDVNENDKGLFMHIKDGTGRIQVIMWRDNVDNIRDNHFIDNIKRGIKVDITGRVEIYKNELEIIVNEDGVKVVI